MLNDFANEIEEIIHLAGGSNTTLAQVRQDLSVIVERMRAAQQSVHPTLLTEREFEITCQNCGAVVGRAIGKSQSG